MERAGLLSRRADGLRTRPSAGDQQPLSRPAGRGQPDPFTNRFIPLLRDQRASDGLEFTNVLIGNLRSNGYYDLECLDEAEMPPQPSAASIANMERGGLLAPVSGTSRWIDLADVLYNKCRHRGPGHGRASDVDD